MAQKPPMGPSVLIIQASRSHSIKLTTIGRTPLDEGSARRGNLYLTTHNTHNRHPCRRQDGFEPTIPASELPQTHALECAADGTVHYILYG
jgi:hypothetical protein